MDLLDEVCHWERALKSQMHTSGPVSYSLPPVMDQDGISQLFLHLQSAPLSHILNL